MKNVALTTVSICLYFSVISQDTGIRFEKGLSWEQIQAKAKNENKFIFVDCYTTWCGPCKYMSRNIFPIKETGDAVNPHFISFGMQLDSTSGDPDAVKSSYADAHMIATTYHIQAYPTYLFFNPQGKLVHRAVGSTDAAHFISYTEDALHPEKQYYSLIDQYRDGKRDTLFLESLGQQAAANGDLSLGDSVLKDWFKTIQNPFTKDRLDMIAQVTKKTGDPGFELFYHHAEEIDRIQRPNFAEVVVMNCIIQENPQIMDLFGDPTAVPDWDRINLKIAREFDENYAPRIVTWVKLPYYKMKKKYGDYSSSLIVYLKEYGDYVQPEECNRYAWDIFQYCTSADNLAIGLSLSSRSIKSNKKPNPDFMDTYANLLYKSGKTVDAIAKETEVVNLAEPPQRQRYQSTLDKMKAGQKTWD